MQKAGVANFEACERSLIYFSSNNNLVLSCYIFQKLNHLIIGIIKMSTDINDECVVLPYFFICFVCLFVVVFGKTPFCKMKPFLPAHLMCIKCISFRKMLSNAPYALYSCIFPVGREKIFNNLLCSQQFKSKCL